jgi:hypothetical protein
MKAPLPLHETARLEVLRDKELGDMNLREEALALWQQKQSEQTGQGAAHAEGHRERRRVTLQKQVKEHLGRDVEPTSDVIEIDGIWFGLSGDQWHPKLVLLTPCPTCGKLTAQARIQGMAYLAEALGSGKAEQCSTCYLTEMHQTEDEQAARRRQELEERNQRLASGAINTGWWQEFIWATVREGIRNGEIDLGRYDHSDGS